MTMKVMEGFHHKIYRQIAGMTTWRGAGGEWQWDAVEEAQEESGLLTMRYCVHRLQTAIEDYIEDQPI